MRRRDFLVNSALGALALTLPRRVFGAVPGDLPDRYWVFVDANGAWDPTFFCDPKPEASELFVHSDVFQSGDLDTNGAGVTYAPFSPGDHYMDLKGEARFFEKYSDRLRVINGFDGQTNNHKVGSRSVWSGSLAAGHPSLGGLIAAAYAQVPASQLPLAFLSTGGFDGTQGLVPATRVAETEPLLKLTYPNLKKADKPNLNFHHADALAEIKKAQAARTERLLEEQGLPQIKAGLERLMSARNVEGALQQLMEPLNDPNLLPEVDASISPLLPAARVAMAAMFGGICRCANLSMAGFDSHSDHDHPDPAKSGQRPRLRELCYAIDYVWETAKLLGFDDKLVVVVASDFGRTIYNAPKLQIGDGAYGPGKDHWPITSLMLMAKGGLIPGGVIGETTVNPILNGVLATHVKASGESVVLEPGGVDDPTATLIRQVHVHHILRCIAGVKDHPLGKAYPIWRPGDFPLPIVPGVGGWETF